MFRSLHAKLGVTLVVLVAALGALVLTVMHSAFERQRLANDQELNRALAARLVDEYFSSAAGAVAGADRKLFDAMMRINPAIELYRLDAAGKIVSYSAPPGKVVRDRVDLSPVERFLAGTSRAPLFGDDPRDAGRAKIFSAAPIEREGVRAGYLYVVIGGENRDSIVASLAEDQVFKSAAWLTLVGLALVLFVGFTALSLFTARLARLERAISRFRDAGFDQPVPYVVSARPGREDEIDRLGVAYNEMADRIVDQLHELRRNDAARRDLIANVSHDLRTPLASLHGYLDTLLLKGDSLPERERRVYLEIAAKHSTRLGQLVTQFFELAKLDARDVELVREPFLLPELVQDVLQQFAIEGRARDVALKMELAGEQKLIRADIGLIERVLANLVKNAIRHTPGGGSIEVTVRADAAAVTVEVADTGSGIPSEALPYVFDRSFTLDKSRTGASGGSGLGLAIVKRIVELHGGTIGVESALGHGARFTFVLPAGQE